MQNLVFFERCLTRLRFLAELLVDSGFNDSTSDLNDEWTEELYQAHRTAGENSKKSAFGKLNEELIFAFLRYSYKKSLRVAPVSEPGIPPGRGVSCCAIRRAL